MDRPIKRSKVRVLIGKILFKTFRYFDWYFGTKKFACERIKTNLPFTVIQHRTPLLRNLRNLDMWMQYNKVNNLERATSKISGIVIKPGETFSYWRTIGKASKRKGYKKGMVLYNGKIKPGIGGGLCQLSNLIYWITLHTSLTVTERYRHSYDVFPDSDRTQPFGSGATCIYNYRDLQIYNGTNTEYQLIVYLNNEYLFGEWRSQEPQTNRYKVYEKMHRIEHLYWGGYVRSNELYRKIYNKDGDIIGDEYVTSNEAIMMYQPFIEEKKNAN